MNTQKIKKSSKLYRRKTVSQNTSYALSLTSQRVSPLMQTNYLLDLSVDFFRELNEMIQPFWQSADVKTGSLNILSHVERIYELLLKANYSREYARVSRYVLFSVADDLIANSVFGKQCHWNEDTFLKKLYHETPEQDKFYLILEKVLQEANLYIDLLECMYVCLQMGYRGIYREDDHENMVSSWMRSVYHCILLYRGHVSQRLTVSQAKISQTKPSNTLQPFIILWGAICLALLFFIIGGFWMEHISHEATQFLAEVHALALR